MDKKVDEQEKNITILQTEFGLFKKSIDEKFEQVFDKLKPQISSAQFAGFGLIMISYFVGIMLYTEGIKSDARNNETRIETLEIDKELQQLQYKTIMDGIGTIKTDIAVIKAKDERGSK